MIAVFGLSAVGFNGIFPCDVGCEGTNLPGKLHIATGLGGFLSMLLGLVILSRRMARVPNWQKYGRYTWITAAVAFVGLVAWNIGEGVGVEDVDGLLQRLFVVPFLIWIEVTAIRLFRESRSAG